MLEIRDLLKRFHVGSGPPIHAVDALSMSARAGEFVAVYGPSGSGKTTLLELIAGLQVPDSGSILVAGNDVVTMSRKQRAAYRRNQLGIIGGPQNLWPGARTVDNASLKLMLTDVRAAGPRIEPLLGELGLGDRLSHRTEELSMGERQRVLIALALSLDPQLVLADEPTGSLDTQRTRAVLELLRNLCTTRQMTLVVATHDPQVAAFADQVHELRDGRLGHYKPDDMETAKPHRET